MKKYFKITILTIIMMLVGIPNAYATDNANNPDTTGASVKLTPSATEVKAGDTFTVKVLVKCESGIEGVDGTLQYDKTKLELSTVDVNSQFRDYCEEDANGLQQLAVVPKNGEYLKEAEIITLTFKVLESVKVDEIIDVKLANTSVVKGNTDPIEKVEIAEAKTTVKVASKSVNKDDKDDSKKPDGNTSKPGNTAANKVITYAGLENYSFAIIAIMVAIVFVSYIKYKQYKKID